MTKYKAYKDQILEVEDVNVEVDSFENENPQIEKVRLTISEKDHKITCNLTKKEVERKKKVVDGQEITTEQEVKRNLYFNELPDIFVDLAEQTENMATQLVKATVTRGIDEENDNTFFFINQNHLGSLKMIEESEKESETEDKDRPENVEKIVQEHKKEKESEQIL